MSKIFTNIITLLLLFNSILFAKNISEEHNNLKKMTFTNNNFLFISNEYKLNSGLYCSIYSKRENKKIINGFIEKMTILENGNIKKIILTSGSFNKGVARDKLIYIKIDKNCHILNKMKLLNYTYDMESGLCGREELNIVKSGEIKHINYNQHTKILTINELEQNCSNKKIKNKKLLFNIDKEKLIY